MSRRVDIWPISWDITRASLTFLPNSLHHYPRGLYLFSLAPLYMTPVFSSINLFFPQPFLPSTSSSSINVFFHHYFLPSIHVFSSTNIFVLAADADTDVLLRDEYVPYRNTPSPCSRLHIIWTPSPIPCYPSYPAPTIFFLRYQHPQFYSLSPLHFTSLYL